MIRYLILIPVFIVFVTATTPVLGQYGDPFLSDLNPDISSFYFDSEFSFIMPQLSTGSYIDSRFRLTHLTMDSRFETSIGFNQGEIFQVINPDVAVILPGNTFISPGMLRDHPSTYDISIPVVMSGGFRRGSWKFHAYTTVLNEEVIVDTPELIVTGGNNIINWNKITSKRTSVFLSGHLAYELSDWNLGAGLTNARLFQSGQVDTAFDFKDRITPYLYLEYRHPELAFINRSQFREFQLYMHKPFNPLFLTLSSRPSLEVNVIQGIGRYEYTNLTVGVRFPLVRDLFGYIRYSSQWDDGEPFERDKFRDWRQSIYWAGDRKIVDMMPHKGINVGISLPLIQSSSSKISVESEVIIHPHLFASRLAYYARNPIAYVKIRNRASRTISASFSAWSHDGSAFYNSSMYQLQPSEVVDIPIYYVSPFTPERTRRKMVQYVVEMEVEGNKSRVANFPLTLLGPNAWDGNVGNLSYFMEQDHPAVRARSQSLFLQEMALSSDSSANHAQQTFHELSSFLTALGRDIRYLNDGVQSFEVDHVQYPLETLLAGGGDCEDLVVYIAAHLMSMGHNIAVADLRPDIISTTPQGAEQNRLAHLFLIVDTNIPSEFSGVLNLPEFSYISRKNRFGNNTIWIPFETTVMDKGFFEGWSSGTLQYYKHFIQNRASAVIVEI